MLQHASSSPLIHPGLPPATSGGLGDLVPDLNSGPSEGHLNMRVDQSQVGPSRLKNATPRRGLPWPEQNAKGAASRVAWI